MTYRRNAVFICLLLLSGTTLADDSRRWNVLFIAVDDLNCALGCYGDPLAKTPHIDALASRGVLFERAYCQIPLCNPSRASVLTGLRPDTLGVYDLDRHFRESAPDVVTLPQLFRNNGWVSARVGKIYHYDVPRGIGTNGLDDAPSWDRVINPKGRDTREEHLITNAEPHRPVSAALSWLAADGEETEQTDGMIATQAIELLEDYQDRPFFLGVGFFRPHTPYVAPKAYFEEHPLDRMQLPYAPPEDRDDIPPAAFAHNCPIPNYGLDVKVCRQAKQAYYASVSFVDAQVGRVLDALNRLKLADSTIVVFWSDHGYHLGEHNGIWQKRCLFEESARAPLIILAPQAQGNGQSCRRVVEFLDIYPTVADLCGLTLPAERPGKSRVAFLNDPHAKTETHGAVTQILRPGDGSPVMGRSLRTDRWRYTEWNGGEAGTELYDHDADPHEFDNLADDPRFESVIKELRQRLETRARSGPPTTPVNPARL